MTHPDACQHVALFQTFVQCRARRALTIGAVLKDNAVLPLHEDVAITRSSGRQRTDDKLSMRWSDGVNVFLGRTLPLQLRNVMLRSCRLCSEESRVVFYQRGADYLLIRHGERVTRYQLLSYRNDEIFPAECVHYRSYLESL